MNRQRRSFSVAMIEALLRFRGQFPLKYHYRWGRWIAWQIRCLFRYRTDVTMTNLARSFPEKKYGELKEISKQFYAHLGDVIAEAQWFSGCRGKRGRERFRRQNLVECTNPELLNGYREAGKTVIVFSSHTGNWELIGSFFEMARKEPLRWKYNEFAVIYRAIRSRTWDRVFRDSRLGLIADVDFDGYVESGDVLRYVTAHADQPMLYVFPNDQAPYGNAAPHDVGTFLHQPTQGMAGGAALARRFAMPVVYMRWRVIRRGRYEVTCVPITDDASSLSTDEIMHQYYSLLEADIQAQPFNYLWTHKRWK